MAPEHLITRRTWILSLAAVLAILAGGSFAVVRFVRGGDEHAARAASNANREPTVETVEEELANASAHYERAIQQLQAVAERENGLPADAAAKLQVSLAQVDKYIAASRAALAEEPASEPARESLFAALRHKVEILQDTVALMNTLPVEMTPAPAAAKAPGTKKS